jgi:hypothetical protein
VKDDHEDAVLDRAVRLLHEDERHRDQARTSGAFERAAEEAGIPRAYLERAAEQLAAEAKQRRRRGLAAGAALVLAGVGLAGWQLQAARAAETEQARLQAEAEARAAQGRAEIAAQRARTVTVSVRCTTGGAEAPCPAARRERLAAVVKQAGLLVSDVASKAARALSVEYAAEPMGEEEGFVYARCVARAELRDLDDDTISAQHRTASMKGGHVEPGGAITKGCDDAERAAMTWLSDHLQ